MLFSYLPSTESLVSSVQNSPKVMPHKNIFLLRVKAAMTLKGECVNLVSLHGMQDASYRFTANTLNEQHPKRSPIDHIIHTVQHSEQTERVLHLPRSNRPTILIDEVMVTAVLGILTILRSQRRTLPSR